MVAPGAGPTEPRAPLAQLAPTGIRSRRQGIAWIVGQRGADSRPLGMSNRWARRIVHGAAIAIVARRSAGFLARLPDSYRATRAARIPTYRPELPRNPPPPPRMPLLDHAMLGRGGIQTRELIADRTFRDHLLNFAQPLGGDLATSSVTSRASGSLAARNSSPSRRTSSPRRGAGTVRQTRKADCARSQAAATSVASGPSRCDCRRLANGFERTVAGHTQLAQNRRGLVSGAHRASSFALAIAATPASIVSSRLAKHRRTRCLG